VMRKNAKKVEKAWQRFIVPPGSGQRCLLRAVELIVRLIMMLLEEYHHLRPALSGKEDESTR
jgi:hypothetical protein